MAPTIILNSGVFCSCSTDRLRVSFELPLSSYHQRIASLNLRHFIPRYRLTIFAKQFQRLAYSFVVTVHNSSAYCSTLTEEWATFDSIVDHAGLPGVLAGANVPALLPIPVCTSYSKFAEFSESLISQYVHPLTFSILCPPGVFK